VAVDESGEKRGAAKINDARSLWGVRLDFGCGAYFLDAFAINPEGGVVEVRAFADVEEAGGFENDGGVRFGGSLGVGGGEEGEKTEYRDFHGQTK
jgi:hypothetical protein